MAEILTGLYSNHADAEAAARDLAHTGLEHQVVTLEQTASVLDLASVGYRETDRLTSGQAASWGLLVGAVLGIIAALVCLWIFPRGYRAGGPLLAAGPWPTLLLGALLGALAGGFTGAWSSARPPRSLSEAREQVRLTVQAPDHLVSEVVAALRRHHPLGIEQAGPT